MRILVYVCVHHGDDRRKPTPSFRARIIHSHSHGGEKSKTVLLVKKVQVDSLSNCELMIGESTFVHQQHVALTLDKIHRSVF